MASMRVAIDGSTLTTAGASVSVKDGTGCGEPSNRRSEEHTSELQSQSNLVCRLLLEKKKINATLFSCALMTRITPSGLLSSLGTFLQLPLYTRCTPHHTSNIIRRWHDSTIAATSYVD